MLFQTETKADSYGAGFASAGGGLWATLFDSTGISIWFWGVSDECAGSSERTADADENACSQRADIPSSISSAGSSLSVADWGTPSANYPASSCDIAEFFQPQQIVIDITLCGDW